MQTPNVVQIAKLILRKTKVVTIWHASSAKLAGVGYVKRISETTLCLVIML
jgi:hypothetical protein